MTISIIVAAAQNNAIGKNNELLWHLSEDLKRFKRLTTGHSIIMGRKTFDSIGKPLPNRRSIIITRQHDLKIEGCEVVHSLDEAIQLCKGEPEVFIIGGAEIYKQSLEKANKIYLTRVYADFEGDAFFPEIHSTWKELHKEAFTDEKSQLSYAFIDLGLN